MTTDLSCPICNENTLIEVKRSVPTRWGDFQMELIDVPLLECTQDKEQVYDMTVARFMQLLTRFFSEEATHVSTFLVTNLQEYFNDRNLQNKFFEVFSREYLKMDDNRNFYISNIDLILIKEKMMLNKQDTIEDFKLAARDAKVDEDDIFKMTEHIRGDEKDGK